MRNQVSAGPVRLNYTVRGPELAVAMPRGDQAAFDDLIPQLSQIWNGVGTLLLPVDDNGDVIGYSDLLPMLRPDHVYLHRSLNDEVAGILAHDHPGRTSRWSTGVLERELHPWWLLGARSTEPRVQLLRPIADNPEMQRMIWTLWGDLDDEDIEHTRRYFDVQVVDADLEHALVHAQIHRRSPLAWSARATDYVECVNAGDQRILFIFSANVGLDELLAFWNLRARMQTSMGEAMVVGLPAAALEQPRTLGLLLEWLDRSPRGSKPDIRVSVSEKTAERAQRALIEAGLTHVDTGRFTSWSSLPAERQRPEFTLRQPLFPMKLRRGLAAEALVGLAEGRNPLHLAPPEGLPPSVYWKGLMRVELRGLPIAFPLTDPLARICMDHAQATDRGLVAAVQATAEPLRLELRLPNPEAQLQAHLTSCGFAARESGAGRIASTLLGRLADVRGLNALAHPFAADVLEALVPRSRPKLAQHIAKELRRSEAPVVFHEQVLVNLLREEGLFSELQARTLDEIASTASRPRAQLLEPLDGLVKSALLQRGRRVTCPRCRFPDYWALRELDEQLTCRACRELFVLPAAEGSREASVVYRLDGLAARAMDQDLLPVLLTLRHLLTTSSEPDKAFWWPGLDLFDDPESHPVAEIDLLVASSGRVHAVECKADAGSLSAAEARDHLELADRLRARAAFGALRGEWRPEVTQLVEEDAVDLLGPETLLHDA